MIAQAIYSLSNLSLNFNTDESKNLSKFKRNGIGTKRKKSYILDLNRRLMSHYTG